MQYSDFLQTVKIIRMLYGMREAQKFFEKNLVLFPNLEYNGLTTIGKNQIAKESSTHERSRH